MYGGNNTSLAKESKINIPQLKKQAERGDAKAQNKLGDYYASIIKFPDNKGCFPYNRKQSIKWYKRAAQQGYIIAQRNLGALYSGMICSDDKGMYWYKKAALKGDIVSQIRLGYLYYMSEEFQKAIFWYKKAANTNNTTAMRLLGDVYQEYSYDKAIFWYKKAINSGNSDASLALCQLYFIPQDAPEIVKKRYKDDGIPKDLKKSDKYCLISANQGNAEAQFTVGAQYMTGRRVPKDEKKAMEYFKKSCLQKYDMGCKAYHGKMNFNDVTY